ncbi:MAG: entericidin A/B family lipoprotein [Caulobacteraceae bacterium]
MSKLIVCVVVLCSLAIGACNTVAGAGKDVSSVGNAVTDTAHDASH